MSIIFVFIAINVQSKISFSKKNNLPTFFQFYFYFYGRLDQKVDFIFIFISPPRLNFFEKFPVKQTIKKCWPYSEFGKTVPLKMYYLYQNILLC